MDSVFERILAAMISLVIALQPSAAPSAEPDSGESAETSASESADPDVEAAPETAPESEADAVAAADNGASEDAAETEAAAETAEASDITEETTAEAGGSPADAAEASSDAAETAAETEASDMVSAQPTAYSAVVNGALSGIGRMASGLADIIGGSNEAAESVTDDTAAEEAAVPTDTAGTSEADGEAVFTASKSEYSFDGEPEWSSIVVNEGAVVNLDGAEIEKPDGASPVLRVESDSAASISGGTLSSSVSGVPVISADGSGAKISIDGAAVWSGGSDAPCAAVNGGSVSVTGGSLTASAGSAAEITGGSLTLSGCTVKAAKDKPLIKVVDGASISLSSNTIEGGSSLMEISGSAGFRADISLSSQTVSGDIVNAGPGSGWGRIDMILYSGADWTGAVQSGRWSTGVNVSLYGSAKWRVSGASYISSLHVDALSNLFARGREVEIHTHSFTVGRTSIYSEVKYGSVRIIVD